MDSKYVAVGVGASGDAYVHNPNAYTSGGVTIHPDFTLPRGPAARTEYAFAPLRQIHPAPRQPNLC